MDMHMQETTKEDQVVHFNHKVGGGDKNRIPL